MSAHHDYYARHSRFTLPGRHAALLERLPNELAGLVRIVQGLVIYDVVAREFYGVEPADERADEIHLRHVSDIVDGALRVDARPLTEGRPPERRLAGRCHHFALLLVAMLRQRGVPARARCGLADYFNPGYFEDHWVCEHWDGRSERWLLVDAQLDEVWREKLGIDFDVFHVPRDRFLVAGDAWARCRSGEADPSRLGIHHAGLRGLWFVAGDVIRDLAALNKDEMLPWDVWGAQPRPDQDLDDLETAYFDELAALSRDPDGRFEELRASYRNDDRIRVPTQVENALLGYIETVR